MIGGGLLMLLLLGAPGGLWMALIGWFLIAAATAETRMATIAVALGPLRVADAMATAPVSAQARSTVAEFIETRFSGSRHAAYPVLDGERVAGMLGFRDLTAVPAAEWEDTRIEAIARPLASVLVLEPGANLGDATIELVQDDLGRALVLEGERLVGLLSMTDVSRLIELRTGPGSGPPGATGELRRWAIPRRFVSNRRAGATPLGRNRAESATNPHRDLAFRERRPPPSLPSLRSWTSCSHSSANSPARSFLPRPPAPERRSRTATGSRAATRSGTAAAGRPSVAASGSRSSSPTGRRPSPPSPGTRSRTGSRIAEPGTVVRIIGRFERSPQWGDALIIESIAPAADGDYDPVHLLESSPLPLERMEEDLARPDRARSRTRTCGCCSTA